MDKRFYLTFGRAAAATLLLIAAQAASAAATAVDEAQTLMGQGQYDQALKKVEGQLKTAPQDAEARFLRGLILVKLNRGPEAVKVFADLTRDYPQLPEPYNNLAVLYAQQGDYEKARDALEAALATHPSYATAHENLGDIYAALAGAAYNRALTLDQSNQLVRSKLALISQLDRPGSAGSTPAIASPSVSSPTAPPAALPPPPASVPSAAATLDAATVQTLTGAVNDWAAAWSSKDVSAYFAMYAPGFIPEGSVTRGTWEAQRRDRISRAARISVKALGPQVERVSDERVAVTFTQDYESDSFSDKVAKTLELQRVGESWLIVREYTR